MRTLAIIPARGGSKGVPGKNIRPLCGKPLIYYSIDAARASKKLDEIIVSTDSDEIENSVRKYDENLRIVKRPNELAQDLSPVQEAISHAMSQLANEGHLFDAVILLQPTSPLRTGADIDKVITMLDEDHSIDSIISVIKVDEVHPARMYGLDKNANLTSHWIQYENVRRQDLPVLYYRNGCIYGVRNDVFQSEGKIITNQKKGYIMDAEWMINIDTERDFLIAEPITELWLKEQRRG